MNRDPLPARGSAPAATDQSQWARRDGGGSEPDRPGAMLDTPSAGGGGNGGGTGPGSPPPGVAPVSGPPTWLEGVYTPTADEGAPGRGDGNGSPPGAGAGPGSGAGPRRYNRGTLQWGVGGTTGGAPLSLRGLSLQASVDVLPAMEVTTPVAPKVRRFVPFVGNKDQGAQHAWQRDVGQKDGAPQAAPSPESPLMSGEETTDPVPCGSAVVRSPSDAAWDSKGATVYYRRAVINLCDSEGDLQPREMKMPIAINSPAGDGMGALGAVVRYKIQPGRG